MGIIGNALRPYWMHGIHSVSGPIAIGLAAWVRDRSYQIYSPIAEDRFTLTASDIRPLQSSFAADISRLGSAAFETVHLVDEPESTPKACAWFVMRSYYAAYYAANTISRILGTSTSQLESEHTRAVHEVADLYGQATVPGIQTGLYECVFSNSARTLACKKHGGPSGAHEAFWSSFLSVVRTTRDRILLSADLSEADRDAAAKLIDLGDNLCLQGRNGGNWLSYIRNQVTYRHDFGAWFPYRNGRRRSVLLKILNRWKDDAAKIDLASFSEPSIERFTATCAFLVSLCREMLKDVARRSGSGRSFLETGPHAYLNRIKAISSRDQ